MDREIWQAVVHGVSKSQTRLSDFHTHTHTQTHTQTHTHTHTRRVWSVAGAYGFSPFDSLGFLVFLDLEMATWL